MQDLKDELDHSDSQVRRMRLEKAQVEKWVRIETEKVTHARRERESILEEIRLKKSELKDREINLQDLMKELTRKDVKASGQLSLIKIEQKNLDDKIVALKQMTEAKEKELNNKANQLGIRQNSLIERERFVNNIFKTLEELKNGNNSK